MTATAQGDEVGQLGAAARGDRYTMMHLEMARMAAAFHATAITVAAENLATEAGRDDLATGDALVAGPLGYRVAM